MMRSFLDHDAERLITVSTKLCRDAIEASTVTQTAADEIDTPNLIDRDNVEACWTGVRIRRRA